MCRSDDYSFADFNVLYADNDRVECNIFPGRNDQI